MGKDGDGKRKKDVLNMQELDTSKNRRSDARASVGELSPSTAMDVSTSAVHVRTARAGNADRDCSANGLVGPWKLSEREVVVLNLLVKTGATSKLLGRALGISHNTVETHMQAAYRKLGADNRTQCALVWDRLLREAERVNNNLAARLRVAALETA